jgi:ribonuclease T1
VARRPVTRLAAVGAVLALLLLAGLLRLGTDDRAAGPGPVASSGASTRPGSTAATGRDPVSGLPLVDLAALPREARQTVALVERGGPFPYRRDGVVFENRQRVLPRQAPGYYREYTVPTPGSDDRGERRLVSGDQAELFYTDDHYLSFVRVRR